jgi:hypothetical protein
LITALLVDGHHFAATVQFRELAGGDFEQFTRHAPVKLLLALSRFTEPADLIGVAAAALGKYTVRTLENGSLAQILT